MPYHIIFDEKEGIVRITFTGISTIEDHYAAFSEALQLCEDHKSNKLLVDFSALDSSNISTMDVYKFGEFVAEIRQVLHIAHVFSSHSKVRENIEFASNVEANRGKLTGEFDDIDEAVNWLQNFD